MIRRYISIYILVEFLFEMERNEGVLLGSPVTTPQCVMDGGRTANGLKHCYGGQKAEEEEDRRN